jgi:TonB-dependent starch-binding outer membrane protein SusC
MMTAQDFYHAYNDVVKAENPKASPVSGLRRNRNLPMFRPEKRLTGLTKLSIPHFKHSHVIALSGGNENSTHYFSTSYLSEKGNLLHTGYERFNLKGSIDSKIERCC